MKNYFKTNWLPLALTAGFVIVMAILTVILLNKNQITVDLAEIPLRDRPNRNAKQLGYVTKHTKLRILQEDGDWTEVRKPNEKTGWVATWLLDRKTPLKKLTPMAETTIVLDPGHGGSDTGALSNDGQYEKTYTLKTALAVRKALEAYGAKVIMTRHTDKLVYLKDIPEIANRAKADAFVSFHFDSYGKKNVVSGLTTYYYHKDNGSLTLAKTLNAQMDHFPMKNRGVDFGNFEVIRNNKRPAVLLEMGYINTNKDFKAISSPGYPNKVAKAVTSGLDNYFYNESK
ncbi:N-acetylmuramoyl-L-alanine amidase [Periweissella cryptocerci]|uniref:N-acetylmuramoyl-L-alanine amidase n=1 Tax=Periweissella cryptocerci TaxID=2506420 RepID=A0A4P6YWI7_9LACO|nr:N-acetylmuramoyl-L-alanine amidase [Periweissella cryptocerci]QBO37151.1 N-acetylmuramoyl-L-alanine amidase [Periweissella cryptocerci]